MGQCETHFEEQRKFVVWWDNRRRAFVPPRGGVRNVMGVSAEPSVDGWPSASQIDDLLDVAGVGKNATTQCDLAIALSYARSAYMSEQPTQKRPTPELLHQLQKSILKTRALLARLKKYSHTENISWEVHPLDTGIVKAMPFQSFQSLANLGQAPIIPDATVIGIDMQKLLLAWHDNVRRLPRRKRGQPVRQAEGEIVFYAAEFFCRHSARKPSNDAKNPFPAFAEIFYETVTGTESPNLDWQIRLELKNRRRAGD